MARVAEIARCDGGGTITGKEAFEAEMLFDTIEMRKLKAPVNRLSS